MRRGEAIRREAKGGEGPGEPQPQAPRMAALAKAGLRGGLPGAEAARAMEICPRPWSLRRPSKGAQVRKFLLMLPPAPIPNKAHSPSPGSP